jgi:hypothetical protein
MRFRCLKGLRPRASFMKIIVFFIAWFPALAGVLLVQHKTNNSNASSNLVSVPVTAFGPNNLIVVGVMGSAGDSVASITDNATPPNIYVQVPGSRGVSGGGRWTELWRAINSSPGATSVTITVNATNSNRKIGEVWEASGADTVSPLDGNGVSGGSFSGSVDTGPSITVTNPGDFIVALARTNNIIQSENDSTFILDDITGGFHGASHAIPSTIGTFTPIWNDSGSSDFVSSVAAFKASGTPPPPPPIFPSNPIPPPGTTGVVLAPVLFWAATTNTTSYDVFFGTVSPPPFAANVTVASYQPGVLTSATTYFWFVTAKGNGGNTSSPVWSFTTSVIPPPAPSAPSNPVPTSGSTGVPVTSTLSWTASTNATSYDVFFGQSSVPPFVGNMTGTSYSPGILLYGTTYHWSVTAKGAGGNTVSPTWSFTTAAAPALLPSITSFTAVPPTINAGQSTTLSWQTANATSASINLLGAEQANGSVIVSPLLSTTYTLTALNSSGSVTSQVTVTVIPTPPLSTKTFSVGNLSCTLTNNGAGVLNAVCTIAGVQVYAGSLRTTDNLPTALIAYPSSGADSIFILAWPNPSGFTWQATIDQGPSQSGTL